jgi:mycothiol synthase
VSLPEGYAARAAGTADLDDLVALFKACDLADVGFEDPVREHLSEDLELAERDGGMLLVTPADRSPAASATVHADNPELSVETFIRVHPDHRGRGLGVALLRWSEERAAAVAAPGAEPKLRNAVPATDERALRLLADHGYEPVRTFWHMERALDGSIAEAPAPPGIRVRDYRHDVDADALYDATEEAFADHWGYEPYPRERHLQDMERADPGLVGVALDGEDIVGTCISRLVEGTGWVDVVAVRRPWRGRSIAKALLLRSFAALAERGAASVALNVDAASQTGATRLYERVGMHVHREWRLLEKPLGAREEG